MKTPHFPPPERVRLCLVRTERGIITTSLCQIKSRTKEEIEQIRLWAAAASHPPVCLFTADSLFVFSEDRLFCWKLSDGAEAAAARWVGGRSRLSAGLVPGQGLAPEPPEGQLSLQVDGLWLELILLVSELKTVKNSQKQLKTVRLTVLEKISSGFSA